MKTAAMNFSATSNTHPLQDSHENPTSPAVTHPKYSASTAPITSGTHAGAQKARPSVTKMPPTKSPLSIGTSQTSGMPRAKMVFTGKNRDQPPRAHQKANLAGAQTAPLTSSSGKTNTISTIRLTAQSSRAATRVPSPSPGPILPMDPGRDWADRLWNPAGPDDWDCNCIHDPFPLIYKGKIYMYYKGSPGQKRGGANIIRAQGVAIADHPEGPYEKSPLNPVLNSGHETCLWPYKEGIAAIVSLDGPEKNTVQYAPDGIHFEMKSLLQVPPVAPGPFVPDAFADNGDGRGITWGLCHINPDGGGSMSESVLARFDCDLSRDTDRPLFKNNNLRFDEPTYFQRVLKLPEYLQKQILKEQDDTDQNTIGTFKEPS